MKTLEFKTRLNQSRNAQVEQWLEGCRRVCNMALDIVAWADEQALLLEQKRWHELDLVNLIKEIRDLDKVLERDFLPEATDGNKQAEEFWRDR